MKIQEIFEAKYGHEKEARNRVTIVMDLEAVPERYEVNRPARYPYSSPYQNAMDGLVRDIEAAGRQIGMKLPDKIGYSGLAGFPEGRFKYNSNAIRDLIRKVATATPGFSLKY